MEKEKRTMRKKIVKQIMHLSIASIRSTENRVRRLCNNFHRPRATDTLNVGTKYVYTHYQKRREHFEREILRFPLRSDGQNSLQNCCRTNVMTI